MFWHTHSAVQRQHSDEPIVRSDSDDSVLRSELDNMYSALTRLITSFPAELETKHREQIVRTRLAMCNTKEYVPTSPKQRESSNSPRRQRTLQISERQLEKTLMLLDYEHRNAGHAVNKELRTEPDGSIRLVITQDAKPLREPPLSAERFGVPLCSAVEDHRFVQFAHSAPLCSSSRGSKMDLGLYHTPLATSHAKAKEDRLARELGLPFPPRKPLPEPATSRPVRPLRTVVGPSASSLHLLPSPRRTSSARPPTKPPTATKKLSPRRRRKTPKAGEKDAPASSVAAALLPGGLICESRSDAPRAPSPPSGRISPFPHDSPIDILPPSFDGKSAAPKEQRHRRTSQDDTSPPPSSGRSSPRHTPVKTSHVNIELPAAVDNKGQRRRRKMVRTKPATKPATLEAKAVDAVKEQQAQSLVLGPMTTQAMVHPLHTPRWTVHTPRRPISASVRMHTQAEEML